MAAHASHMINRTVALLNYAYGTPSMFHNGEDGSPPSYQEYEQDRAFAPYKNTRQLEEY